MLVPFGDHSPVSCLYCRQVLVNWTLVPASGIVELAEDALKGFLLKGDKAKAADDTDAPALKKTLRLISVVRESGGL